MTGERTPDASPSRNSGSSDDVISLREHVQRQMDLQDRHFERVISDMRDLLDQRFIAQEHAVLELKTTTDQRLLSMNEVREQLNSQQVTFMTRVESISRHDRSTEMIAAMGQRFETETRLQRERFENEVKQLRDRHETDMATVNSRLDLNQGRNTGLDKAWGYIIGAIGLAGTVIAIIIATR